MSDSLWPHGLQHAMPPCPSTTPRVYSNSCPSSWWCHPAISSSGVPFSSCLQSFRASGSFPRSQFFTSGGQSIGVSAATSVLPVNTQDWSPLGWTGWISLQSLGLAKYTPFLKELRYLCSISSWFTSWPQLISPSGKNILYSLCYMTNYLVLEKKRAETFSAAISRVWALIRVFQISTNYPESILRYRYSHIYITLSMLRYFKV